MKIEPKAYYVYWAGHGEYLPDPVEESIYYDPEDDAPGGVEELPAWAEPARQIAEDSYGAEMSWFIRLQCDEAELLRRFEAFFLDIADGPAGGDDDTFDYWPSGLRLLRQMAIDVGRVDQVEAMVEALREPLGDYFDELNTKATL